MNALYLCYQSVQEPLTQTQVVAYLEGLALAGRRVILLTFEPRPLSPPETKSWRERLGAKGVAWHWLRYHKRPTVPATAWDVLAGTVAGLRLIRKYRVRLVHARGHVAGLMGLALKRLTGVKLLFDLRGFMAEEYADAGVWPAGGALFRATKFVEHRLVEAADAVVVLTHKAKELLLRWYPRTAAKPVTVIPCCVDFRNYSSLLPAAPANGAARTIVYSGKLGGWYLTEAMVDFVATARDFLPSLRWHVYTQSDPAPLHRLLEGRQLQAHVNVGFVPPDALLAELSKASLALSFVKPCLSKLSSSPTKVGEYLAAGLPVVSTAGIGDLDVLLTGDDGECGAPVGVVLSDCTREAYRAALTNVLQLLDDPVTPDRCRAAAAKHFDLETVGWPRYRGVYQRILGEEEGRS
jgi:glycosyltransferase involved in cell wall biosynthesis